MIKHLIIVWFICDLSVGIIKAETTINFENIDSFIIQPPDDPEQDNEPSSWLLDLYPYGGIINKSRLVGLDIRGEYENNLNNHWYFISSLEINSFSFLDNSDDYVSEAFRVRLRELNFQYSKNQFQISLGWQSLVFGSVEGAEVIDVISPTVNTRNSNIAGEKIAQLMFVLNYYGDKNKVTAFFTPRPSHSFLYDDRINIHELPLDQAVKEQDEEFGIGLSTQIEKLEIQWVFAHLISNYFRMNNSEIYFPSYSLIGASLTYPIRRLLLKSEIARKRGSDVSNNRFEYSLGFEIDYTSIGLFSGFLVVTELEDISNNNPSTDRLVIGWYDQYFNDTLNFSTSLFTNRNFSSTGFSANTRYLINDGLSLEIGVTLLPDRLINSEDVWQTQIGIHWTI